MKKVDRRNLAIGLVCFVLAVVFAALLIFRLTHRGYIGIGPIRTAKLAVLTAALLAAGIYFMRNSF